MTEASGPSEQGLTPPEGTPGSPEPSGQGTTAAEPTADLEPPPIAEPESTADTERIAVAEPTADVLVPTPPAIPVPAVESTRRLIGASFDLLTRTSDDMRRASFYIGAIAVLTLGPFALAAWATEVVGIHRTDREMLSTLVGPAGAWYGVMATIAGLGLVVAAVESRAMAAAILGGHYAGNPVAIRPALARSRAVFWRVVAASLILAIPVYIAQFAISAGLENVLGQETDISIVASTLAAALVGSPLAYLLTGVVLGDVGPLEATRRSFRVFRARKVAAALVAVFETVAVLLVSFGLGAGLDVALKVFGALGLGPESGPAGLALVTIGVIAGVFAVGTLIYTALAISIAPQVVMFVGLTHATFGLDHVRPGGDRDPAIRRPGRGTRFRWLTIPLLIGSAIGVIALAGFVGSFLG